MKKLPKVTVFFDGLFTFSAENLVCKNVEIIGSVMFVQKSNVSIFGMVDNASRLSKRCETASDITFFCV